MKIVCAKISGLKNEFAEPGEEYWKFRYSERETQVRHVFMATVGTILNLVWLYRKKKLATKTVAGI